MLIGCCHCDRVLLPPSESIPPSISGSSGGVETVTRSTCVPNDHRCADDTAPIAFGFTIPDLGGTPCHVQHKGDFVVYLASNPAVCWPYYSVETPIIFPGPAPCSNMAPGNNMWALTIGISGSNIRVTLGLAAQISGFLSSLGTWVYTGGAYPVDCVTPFTLTKTSTDTTGFPLPTSVTVSPV